MFNILKNVGSSLLNGFNKPVCLNKQINTYFSNWFNSSKPFIQCSVSQNPAFLLKSSSKSLLQADSNNLCQSRSYVIKYSLKTGKKITDFEVLPRFYRLNNGLWIRRIAGHSKKVHQKNWKAKYNSRQHVFCTRSQCIMFDKMTTGYHKKRKYFIDDPFEPYHVRHNLDYYIEKRKWVNLQKFNFKLI